MQYAQLRPKAKDPRIEAGLVEMVKAAHAAGAPPDQIRNFTVGGYIPSPQQWEFHAAARRADDPDGPTQIAMGGPRGGAKSHAVMSQVALDDCQRFPGLDVLYLRLIQKAARKALDQLRSKTIMSIRHSFNRNEGLITFPNGSTIVVGHFKNEGDIDKYIGIEYDIIVIEERTQLSQVKIDQLMGSLRTGKPGWRPRTYNNANPGGIGHQDFRTTFVLPNRHKAERDTAYFKMDWRDNPFINPEYKVYLMGLTGILGQMWRDGNWDIGSGTFFINWQEKVHVIKPLDRVPLEWPIWISCDWGWTHPACFQWHTQRPDGTVVTISEYKAQRKLVAEHAPVIKEITQKWDRTLSQISGLVAGHDIFANRGAHEDGLTIAEQFQKAGIDWNPANIDRLNGAAELTKRLGNPREGLPATWFITESCEDLVRAIPNMIIDEKRPEDVLKIDANEFGEGGDDSYDCARYGLMVRPLNLGGGGFGYRY